MSEWVMLHDPYMLHIPYLMWTVWKRVSVLEILQHSYLCSRCGKQMEKHGSKTRTASHSVPRDKVFLEKPTPVEQVKKFTVFYGNCNVLYRIGSEVLTAVVMKTSGMQRRNAACCLLHACLTLQLWFLRNVGWISTD
jgi:hypothetical protein